MYNIELTRSAEEQLTEIFKFDRALYRRVINALESLRENPFRGKRLKYILKREYSLRVGNYRIIYTIHHNHLIIYIIDIGHRRDIYQK